MSTAQPKMRSATRHEIARTADLVVVKVGTRVLTDEKGALDLERLAAIAEQLAIATESGRRVALVSSGAVGAGIGRLGLTKRPTDLADLQAVAAVGQSRLIEAYNGALQQHGRHAAQVLLTFDDLNDRDRYLNARNTLFSIFDYGAVPIVNENDTVRVDELRRNVGDNDRLAAVVTNLLRAPLLVLLSDVDGLYDGDPKQAGSKVIPTVEHIDEEVLKLANVSAESSLQLSTGGMASKLAAARMATRAGESVIIANGRRPNIVTDLLAGEELGTLFMAKGPMLDSRKRWIGIAAQPLGRIVLDQGACQAISERGKSLLPVGVIHVEGDFDHGDVVSLCDTNGVELARGLTNYAAGDVARIQGLATEAIAGMLGARPYLEIVHRDNLVLVD